MDTRIDSVSGRRMLTELLDYFSKHYVQQEDFKLNAIVETQILDSPNYSCIQKTVVVSLVYLSHIPMSVLASELAYSKNKSMFENHAKSCKLDTLSTNLAVTIIRISSILSRGYTKDNLLEKLKAEYNTSECGKYVSQCWAILETACITNEINQCLRSNNYKQIDNLAHTLHVISDFIQFTKE